MARSITERQRNVRLEDIGSGKDDFAPVKLDAVEQTLVEMAILFKTTAEDRLSVQNAIDTGRLADSIQFEQVKYLGGVYSVDIKVLDYYDFVNKGVRGLNGGGNSPYKFKNLGVSKDMLFAIRKWLIRHGLKSNSKAAKKNPLGTERKTRAFDQTGNAMAYAIARSIKKKGLRPTGFWDAAEKKTAAEMEKSLGNAFAVDIVNAI